MCFFFWLLLASSSVDAPCFICAVHAIFTYAHAQFLPTSATIVNRCDHCCFVAKIKEHLLFLLCGTFRSHFPSPCFQNWILGRVDSELISVYSIDVYCSRSIRDSRFLSFFFFILERGFISSFVLPLSDYTIRTLIFAVQNCHVL